MTSVGPKKSRFKMGLGLMNPLIFRGTHNGLI